MSRTSSSVLAYIGLGSNLDQPVQQVLLAQAALTQLPASRLVACSSLYCSAPMGPPGQADYINAVAAVQTTLSAQQLLLELQQIENTQGRVRQGERWGPRTLDLDLLLYGQDCLSGPVLTVPHPGMTTREFVLYPLFEIAPQLSIPQQGSVQECMARCPRRGLQRLEQVGESRAS